MKCLEPRLINQQRSYSSYFGCYEYRNSFVRIPAVSDRSQICYDNVIGFSTYNNRYHYVPCGKCHYCRKAKANEILVRLLLHSKSRDASGNLRYPYSYFILLTYDEEHLPIDYFRSYKKVTRKAKRSDGAKALKKGFVRTKKEQYIPEERRVYAPSLCVRDVQNFFKRYRKNTGAECSYFLAGEYGEKTQRPHYHVILFTNKPLILSPHCCMTTQRSNKVYKSKELQSYWKNGFVNVGTDVQEEGFRYVSGYLVKGFSRKHPVKEFCLASRRPALASQYFLTNYQKIFSENNKIRGRFLFLGRTYRAPGYFLQRYKRIDPDGYQDFIDWKYQQKYDEIKEKGKSYFDEIENDIKEARAASYINTQELRHPPDDSWYEEFGYNYTIIKGRKVA